MEAAPGNSGVSTSIAWGSTPARRNTVANPGDILMNTSVWKVKVLKTRSVAGRKLHDACDLRPEALLCDAAPSCYNADDSLHLIFQDASVLEQNR
jgi:hypothetical protein